MLSRNAVSRLSAAYFVGLNDLTEPRVVWRTSWSASRSANSRVGQRFAVPGRRTQRL